jgi:uroporphyrinogen decarboxylase
MVSKDRVAAAIRHRQVDRPPWGEIVIDDGVVRSFLGCRQVSFEERKELVCSLGLDLICLAPEFPEQSEGMFLPQADLAGWGDLEDWARKTDRFPFIILDGAFGWGMRLHGFEQFMVALVRDASALGSLIGDVERLNMGLARQARDRGAMGVLLAEDVAYQRGLMIGPELFRRCFLPSLARQTDALKALGLSVFFHSDGNIDKILPDLAAIGLDGWQCLESAAGMDMGRIKERYGERLCLWGNLDPVHLLTPSPPEEIASRVVAICREAGRTGGFIFGTSSGLMKGILPENLRAVRDCLHRISP